MIKRQLCKPRAALTVALVSSLLLGLPAFAQGHDPSITSVDWDATEIANGSQYKWGSGVEPWLQTVATDALGARWNSPVSNNSKHVYHSYSANGLASVMFVDFDEISGCNPGWVGCASDPPGNGSYNWEIKLDSDPPLSHPWCQESGSQMGCWDARLIMIHEVAHVGGVSHNEDGYLNTVMNASPPTKDQDGWNRLELRRCDTAGLQLAYGVASLAWPYVACYDHLPNTTSLGLKTSVSIQESTTVACLGEAVSFSGLLQIINDPNYGLIKGNILPNRLVTLQKSAVSPVEYFDYSAQATTASATYLRWSAAYTSPQTWKFRVYYAGELGLNYASTAQKTITWSSVC